ncbi:MAG: glycosyltransferase [Clostridia bacterium]|nr:glycosyltransferase [Clostridia bacterium]
MFVINSLGSGGAERVSSKLINHYIDSKCEVHVAYLLNDTTFYGVDKNVVIHKFIRKNKNVFNFLYWIKSLKKCIKFNKIDTIIAIGYKFGILSAFSSNKKTKVLIKATGDSTMTLALKFLYYLFSKKIYAICLQKKEQKQFYPKKIWNRCIVINNPFSVYNQNKNANGIKSKHIICIGRLDFDIKCHDVAIKAFSIFHNVYGDFVLDIYGRCKSDSELACKDKLLKLVRKLNLQNCVYFYGEVKNIHNLIIPSFACLHTSKKEGMPNSMIEAMLLGIPVISTRWAGIESIIQNESNGFIVEQGDYSKIAENLLLLKNNPSLYNFISASSYSVDVEKYKDENVFSKWDRIVYE